MTVSSIILSVITKLVHKRVSAVCAREGFLGSAQYGFRRQLSTTDCVFLLLAAIRKAKRNHRSLSIAFCDLAKAYDSVCWELLYTKLVNIGFGGKMVRLIRSMYYNDNIQFNLMGGLSPPIWFTKGVKQGCSLSPLLFALYISGLGKVLQDTNLGVQLGTEIITAMFLAEDLVLVSSTPKVGMNRLLSICMEFCKDMHMTLSIPKTYILLNASYEVFEY